MTKASSQIALKLQHDPFSTKPDLRFYYAYEAFEQRLALLNRLLGGTDALIVVLGEPGGGKTTLLKRYLDSVASPWRSGRIRARASGPTQLTTLENHPAFIVKDAQDPIILFDDAHALSRTELRYLLKEALSPGSSAKIKRLVLFAEPELLVSLEAMSDNLMGNTALNKIFMPPLDLEESGNYLHHRLLAAGYVGKNPFGGRVVKKLHRLSGGIPGRLNQVAAEWLEKRGPGSLVGRGYFRRFLTPKWIAGAALITGILLIVGILFQLLNPTPAHRKTDPRKNRHLIRAKIPPKQPPSPPISPASPPRPAGDMVSSAAPGIRTPAVQIPSSPSTLKSKPTDAPRTRPIIEAPETTPKPLTVPTAPKPKPGDQERGFQRETWLLAQKPSHYTIQLMGVRKEASLQRFVGENPELKNYTLAYYRTKYRGGPWYPLLCGIYPSPEEARSAIQNLPESIRQMSPWIRKLSRIQTGIRKQKR